MNDIGIAGIPFVSTTPSTGHEVFDDDCIKKGGPSSTPFIACKKALARERCRPPMCC